MFHFKNKKATWPLLSDKCNKSVIVNTPQGLKLVPNSVVVLYDPKQFTQAERARVLSTLDPAKTKAFYVAIQSPLGQKLLQHFKLMPGSYLLHTTALTTKVQQMFFNSNLITELDYLTLNQVSATLNSR